jgi:hypothetical protein
MHWRRKKGLSHPMSPHTAHQSFICTSVFFGAIGAAAADVAIGAGRGRGRGPGQFARSRCCPAARAGRMRRSPNSCGCQRAASRTKCGSSTHDECLARDRQTTAAGSGAPSLLSPHNRKRRTRAPAQIPIKSAVEEMISISSIAPQLFLLHCNEYLHIWLGLWPALADNRSAANAILSASALVAALLIC